MLLITIIPILMMIIGALMYALCANPKLAEMGRLLFAAGAFAVAFYFAGKGVSIGAG